MSLPLAVDREDERPLTPPGRKADGRAGLLVGAGSGLVAVVVLLVGLLVGDAVPAAPTGALEVLPDAGALTGWALPLAELALTVTAAVTVGSLLVAAVLAPGRGRDLSVSGYAALRRTTWWAVSWSALSLAVWLLQMSDVIGAPVTEVLDPTIVANYTRTFAQAQGLLLVAGLTAVVAVGSRAALRAGSATALLAIAVVALLPPAFTGHAATAGDHDIATSSLIVHVLAATLWVGGLAGVLLHLRGRSGVLRTAVPRYSALALACFGAVAFSGAVNAWTGLTATSQLWSTSYGRVLLGKGALLVALGGFGWWHRRRTVGAVLAGRPAAFVRFAAAEVAVMAAAFGLAVALSTSPTPAPAERDTSALSRAEVLLGFDIPAFSAARLLTEWRLDALVVVTAVLAVVLYGAGVRRLRARDITWSPWRTALFVSGVLVVVFAMTSGLATYAMAMFSVHMAQHMTLSMLAPILLALGAPVTLALRTLPASGRDRPRGPREWLLAGLHSRPARLVTHPVVALALYTTSLYGLYYTPLFEAAMRSHGAHLFMSAHFLTVGMIFFWPVLGVDPSPRRLSYPARLLLLAVSLPIHAFFGVTLLGGEWLIAEDWYAELALPGVDPLADQQLGGGIAWAAGEIPSILVLVALLPQWFRADEREARRGDRRADADGDAALEAYNRQLAARAAADERWAQPSRPGSGDRP